MRRLTFSVFLILAYVVCFFMGGPFHDWIEALIVSLFYYFGFLGLLLIYLGPRTNPGGRRLIVTGLFLVVLAWGLLEFWGLLF